MTNFNRHICFTLLALWMVCASTRVQAGQPLVIFAASSLSEVVTELDRLFRKRENHETVLSFAATSVLARQIKGGAPANIFISANTAWMDDVNDADMIVPGTQKIIARNRLALAGAVGISFPPVQGDDLSAEYPLATVAPGSPFAMGNPAHVPVGIYARQALEALGMWPDIKARMVHMPSARSVMANIDRGEVAGGIVYVSDVRFSKNVRIIGLFPPSTHSPIQYVAGIVSEGGTPTADLFLSFLVSPEAENVFKEFGFLPPSP